MRQAYLVTAPPGGTGEADTAAIRAAFAGGHFIEILPGVPVGRASFYLYMTCREWPSCWREGRRCSSDSIWPSPGGRCRRYSGRRSSS